MTACIAFIVAGFLCVVLCLRLVVEEHLVLELRLAELGVGEELFVVFFRFFYGDIGLFVLFHKILLRALDKKSEPARVMYEREAGNWETRKGISKFEVRTLHLLIPFL